jgi:hypothetical protein
VGGLCLEGLAVVAEYHLAHTGLGIFH